MNDQNKKVPEGELLSIANNILSLLEYSSQLEREEDLFLDDFYIAIVSNLVSERKFDIQPGNTLEEKEKSLEKLIDFLSQIIDFNLSHISPHGIIFEHERLSTKYLLELIEELIKALLEQQNQEGVESENQTEKDTSGNQTSIENQQHHNISEDNILQRRNNELEGDSQEIPLHTNTNENNANTPEMGHIDNLEESSGVREHNESDIPSNTLNNKQEKKNAQETEHEEEEMEESSETYSKNKSCMEYLDLDKFLNQKNSSDDSYLRKTYTENDIMRYERQLAEDQFEEQSNYRDDEMNYAHPEDAEGEQERVTNVSHISEVSKSKEHSEQHKQLNTKKRSELSEKNKGQKINYDMNFGGNMHDEIKDISQSSPSVEPEQYKDDIPEDSNLDYLDDEKYKNFTENSAHSVPAGQVKMRLTSSSISNISNNQYKQEAAKKDTQKESARKKTSEKQSNRTSKNTENNLNQLDISKSSVHSKKSSKQNKTSNSTSILEELPLTEEELRAEIIKQIKRIYGNKLDRIALKQNVQNSRDILELIIRNIKLARQKTMKIGSRIPEADDLMTKEFIQRYEKELEYIVKYYEREKIKRNFFQEKALKSMAQNAKVTRKIQEIQTKKIESEIERKRKARELKNHHNQLRMCNEIYSRALQLEKERYLEEINNMVEISRYENEEKRRQMRDIEKFYTDKIAILKEILKREKRDREIEHRAKIQFLSKLEREKKGEFKRQIEEVFQRFDEEDKKAEFEDNNQEEIEKILNNYYKK